MRIRSCEVIVSRPGRNFNIVKVTTDTGLVGWGDATLNGRELAVASCITEHLAPMLIGEDATRIEHLWQAMFIGAYWRGGPVLNTALSGIDMALWDLLGKEAGMPVYRLLGGRVREGANCYCHCSATSSAKLAEKIRAKMNDGYQYVRAQLEASAGSTYNEKIVRKAAEIAADTASPYFVQGRLPSVGEWEPTPYMRSLPKMFAELRAELGDEVELLHDVHQRLTPTQAAGLARELEPWHLFFLEDPVPPEQAGGLAAIRAASTTPIAIGELFTDIATCVTPITSRWLDYLRCDLGHVGGITAGRKLAALAEPFAVKTAWHGPPDLSPVGHAANVHLNLATSNFGVQEWTEFDSISWGDKVREVFRGGAIRRGPWLDVPDAPGLGIEIDEDAARKYAYERDYLPVVRRRDGSVHPW